LIQDYWHSTGLIWGNFPDQASFFDQDFALGSLMACPDSEAYRVEAKMQEN
jgi:hypothetical protein